MQIGFLACTKEISSFTLQIYLKDFDGVKGGANDLNQRLKSLR